MTSMSDPFGKYVLAPWRECLRRYADSGSNTKLGKWKISLIRKASLLGHKPGMAGPLDINVTENVNARLYPGSNRCEKRALAGVQVWDPIERAALDQAIAEKPQAEPFVFLDVGANVGLYSLFVNASAKTHGRKTKIIAVEPDTENRSRLTFNFNASNCDGIIEPIGISHIEGEGVLTEAQENRGGIAIVDGGKGVTIQLETLAKLFSRHDLSAIDAMKIDIEGRDEAALLAMLNSAPKSVWPQLLIVETGKAKPSPIVEQMLQHGYLLQERTGINAILKLPKEAVSLKDEA